MTEFLNAETHTPVLLMNYLWSLCLRQAWIWENTVFILSSLKNRNCEICQRTKITRAPCRTRIGGAVPRAENFGDLITADHKVLSENCESRNNHRYAIVVQDLATQWIQSYPCKTKTSQETQRSLQKFLEPDRKPKVIYTDNSLEFGKACEDLSWNHCTSTPHRSETNGIAERAVRRVKEGTSAVLLQSGLDENWWADSMECYTYLRNVQDLLSDGKTPLVHISEITELCIQESSGENGSLNSHDLEYDDYTIGMALSSPLFTQEREDAASRGRELITLMTKVCRPVSRRLSVIEQGDLLWNSLIHKSQASEKIRAAAQKMSKSGFFCNDKESRFSLIVKQRFKNTNSRPITTEEVFKS